MEQSESIKELAGALAKAQAALKPAEMNATNPFLKNKYADLGEVIKASRQALADAGLSFVQAVAGTGENVIITTQLMHASGEWIRETIAFPLGEARGKSLAQEAGSIITYLRRYSLSSMLGIYADDDTDGDQKQPTNKAEAKPAREQTPAQTSGQMSMETAEAITNSDGIRYGDLPTDKLSSMTIGIDKAIKKTDLTDKQREEYQLKLAAIATILKHRNGDK